MANLQHDIKAIVKTVANDEKLHLGVIEAARSRAFVIGSGVGPEQVTQTERALESLFSRAGENARIALALTENSPRMHCGAWAGAAARFCEDDVAGVLVLEKDRGMTEMVPAERFLDCVPDALWEAALPILFDESGLLAKYSPDSIMLEYDKRLSFRDIDRMLDSENLASIGGWSRGTFPVYDVTGTAEELKCVKKLSDDMLDFYARAARSSLSLVDCWRPSWTRGSWEHPIEAIMIFVELSLPGSTDPTALSFLTDLEQPEDVPWAVSFNRSASTEIKQIEKFGREIMTVAELVRDALQQHHVKFDPTYKDNAMLSAEELHYLLDALGVPHQVEALKQGVPIDDVIA